MHLNSLLPLLASLATLPLALAHPQNNGNFATSTLTVLQASGSAVVETMTFLANSSPSPTGTQQRQESPTTAASEPSITSIIQATRTESVYVPSASGSANLDANGIDVEAGASGSSSGGFSLSKGGMIAVIVVVVCVAVFGVLSITLFILAKKRQWRVRESIKRASRRLTGRGPGPRPRSEVDKRKRSGVIAGSRGQRDPPSTPLVQQKGSAVSETEMKDLEKGEGEGRNGGKIGEGWLGKMKGNDWR